MAGNKVKSTAPLTLAEGQGWLLFLLLLIGPVGQQDGVSQSLHGSSLFQEPQNVHGTYLLSPLEHRAVYGSPL